MEHLYALNKAEGLGALIYNAIKISSLTREKKSKNPFIIFQNIRTFWNGPGTTFLTIILSLIRFIA
jgi:hypothetical protein